MTGTLVFRPLYQPRVWGGRGLASAFARSLPSETKIGESWEIVDRAREQSVVARGPHTGRTIRALIEAAPESIMGPGWDRRQRFPILVKWLDCQERLSLQVHPPAHVAPRLGGEPKTENWYIAHAMPGAALLVGLRKGVTRDAFERALAANEVEPLVHRFPVEPGDSMFVRSGRVHAIDAGNLILEIQQNSDTTYRVYDWGRTGDDGKPRPLHVAESLQCIDFTDFEPHALRPSSVEQVLAECDEFRIRRRLLREGDVLSLNDLPEPRIVSVVSGRVWIETGEGATDHRAGENVLIPADTPSTLRTDGEATILLTDRFSRGAG